MQGKGRKGKGGVAGPSPRVGAGPGEERGHERLKDGDPEVLGVGSEGLWLELGP